MEFLVIIEENQKMQIKKKTKAKRRRKVGKKYGEILKNNVSREKRKDI